MADLKWYYTQSGNRHGPVSESDLRRLVNSGQLKPDDLVWRKGLAEWQEARSLEELFPDGSQTTVHWYFEKEGERHGPIPEDELKKLFALGDIQPTTLLWKKGMKQWEKASVVFPAPAPPTPTPGFLGKAKEWTKALANYAGTKAKIQKLSLVDLPAADNAIGAKAFAEDIGRGALSELYKQIDEIDTTVAKLRTPQDISDTATATDRIKHNSAAAVRQTKVAGLLAKRKGVVTKLGTAIREGGSDSNILHDELTRAREVKQSLSQLQARANDHGIQEPTSSTSPLVPILIIVSTVFLCFPVGLLIVWLQSAWGQKQKLAWSAVCCAPVVGIVVLSAIQAALNPGAASRTSNAPEGYAESQREVAVEAPTVLTERFWPHKPGSERLEKDYSYFIPWGNYPDGMFTKRQITHEDGGIIRKRVVELRGLIKRRLDHDLSPERGDVSLVDESIDYYRIHDGFVEIGSKYELDENQILWRKKLKIGAKVGDRWKDGDSEYEVMKIDDGIATIENTLLGDKIVTYLKLDFGPALETVRSRGREMRETIWVPR